MTVRAPDTIKPGKQTIEYMWKLGEPDAELWVEYMVLSVDYHPDYKRYYATLAGRHIRPGGGMKMALFAGAHLGYSEPVSRFNQKALETYAGETLRGLERLISEIKDDTRRATGIALLARIQEPALVTPDA